MKLDVTYNCFLATWKCQILSRITRQTCFQHQSKQRCWRSLFSSLTFRFLNCNVTPQAPGAGAPVPGQFGQGPAGPAGDQRPEGSREGRRKGDLSVQGPMAGACRMIWDWCVTILDRSQIWVNISLIRSDDSLKALSSLKLSPPSSWWLKHEAVDKKHMLVVSQHNSVATGSYSNLSKSLDRQ